MKCERHRRRIKMVSLALICVLLTFGGGLAASSNPHSAVDVARLDREFKLEAGRQVTVKGSRLRIRFMAVENDSRCPKDVTCVWAGNAAAQFQLGTGRSSKTVTLNTSKSPSFANEIEYHGYKVKLVELSPYPRSDQKIARRDYTATLLVSRE